MQTRVSCSLFSFCVRKNEFGCFSTGSSIWIFMHFSKTTGWFTCGITDRGFPLTGVRGDVYVASLRRLSVAVALSSPQADTQILSRNSLAQRLMVHQYPVQCDTQAPVCTTSSQLLSTVTGPSVTKCCAVTPVLKPYPQHIYDLNEPTSFLLSINNWTATEGAFSTATVYKRTQG